MNSISFILIYQITHRIRLKAKPTKKQESDEDCERSKLNIETYKLFNS